MRDEKGIRAFRDITENAPELIEYFETEDNIKDQGKKWFKDIRNKMYQSFERVRIRKKDNTPKTELDKKFETRKVVEEKLNKETDLRRKYKLEDELEDINEDISKECGDKYVKEITEHIKKVSDFVGHFSRNDYWRLKKKVMPKTTEVPSGKKDKNGKLITNPEMIKDLYLEHYQHVLRDRETLPHLKKYKGLRETLFDLRLKKATRKKSPKFTMKDLNMVLGKLKRGKSQDPSGWVNDPFTLKIN